ncbi:hypothetical protein JHK85_033041 [Glycine max]|uniref:Uncharacterized protein n=1 Tax=Glycine max TaxID=3847 RepID=K7LRX2_SOYBN|nr:hypothetical protein JHK85_033041 [Glycine max]KAH1160848.1 hypothetical protein GYH30_032221 [Glycine max]
MSFSTFDQNLECNRELLILNQTKCISFSSFVSIFSRIKTIIQHNMIFLQ